MEKENYPELGEALLRKGILFSVVKGGDQAAVGSGAVKTSQGGPPLLLPELQWGWRSLSSAELVQFEI